MLGALVFVMASCATDQPEDFQGPDVDDSAVSTGSAQFAHMKVDQSRITYGANTAAYSGMSSYAVTRAKENADAQHPYVEKPSTVVEPEPDVQALLASGVQKYDASKVWSYNQGFTDSMIITEDMPAGEYSMGDLKNLYIANKGASLKERWGSNNITIYILSSAETTIGDVAWNGEINTNISARETYKIWGKVNAGTLTINREDSFQYYGQGPLELDGLIVPANSTFRYWDSLKIKGELTLLSNSKFYYYGEDELEIGNYSQSADKSNIWFECHGPVRYTGTTFIAFGEYWYGDNVVFEDTFKNDMNNEPLNVTFRADVDFKKDAEIHYGTYTFDGTTTLKNLDLINGSVDFYINECFELDYLHMNGNTSQGFNFNVAYFLHIKEGFKTESGTYWNVNLDNSVMVIDKDCEVNGSDNGLNVMQTGTLIIGKGNSAVCFTGSVKMNHSNVQKDKDKVQFFRSGSDTNDKLAVWGKKTGEDESGNPVFAAPKIYVRDTGITQQTPPPANNSTGCYHYDEGIVPLADNCGNVYICPEDFEIAEGNPDDCRSEYTSKDESLPEPPPTVVNPPYHKYSATSLDFSPDGKYVYVAWHSNIKGAGESQPDTDGSDFNHDHGTNVDPDIDDPQYGGPSVEGIGDWGGFVDIIEISKYNPDDKEVEGGLYIRQTLANPEHKYNHIKLYNNTFYLASTSKFVGAALHVAPLNDDGDDILSEGRVYRVNLTGASANCVEVIADQYLATMSGRSVGGLNWFSLGDMTNQERKYKNDKTTDFGGKYVCLGDDGNVYTLHNTDNATVTCYDTSGNKLGTMETWIPMVPYDGKNTLMVRNGKVYICCGRNGLQVFEWNGRSNVGQTGATPAKKVGYTALSANCVDMDADNKYFYVATGAGVAKYKVDDVDSTTGRYKRQVYVSYFGRGFNYPSGEMEEGTPKESSNFVRVHGDKVFVAYGMYGLRIYDAADLTSAGSKPME